MRPLAAIRNAYLGIQLRFGGSRNVVTDESAREDS
jgi:hypothetical protein